MRILVPIVLGVVGSILGCSSPPALSPCTPGRSEPCACVGGGEGAQVCLADNTFGECSCSELDDASVFEDASTSDASTSDASTTDDASAATTALAFASPISGVRYVRGDVFVQVVFTGVEPDEVEYWLNGSIPVSRVTFPFADTWHSDLVAEGTYVFEARATIGGAIVATASRTFDVDRTPPSVVATTPTEAATDANIHTAVRLELSEPIDPATVTDTTLAFSADGTAVSHARTLTSGDTVIEITPTAAPSVPANAVVTLGSAVTDRAGNALQTEFTLAFQYPAWLPVVGEGDLGLLGGSDLIRQIEGTAAGVLWILFHTHPSGSPTIVRIARWTAGTLEVLPNPVPLPVDSVGTPMLRLLSSGLPTIATVAGPSSTTRMEVIALDSSDVWSAPLVTPLFERSGDFDFEVDGSDAPVLLRGTASGYDLLRYSGGTWTAPVAGALTFSSSSQRDLLIQGTHYFLAYRDVYSCRVRTALEGGTWGSPTTLHGGVDIATSCMTVRLVGGGDGVVRVLEDYRVRLTSTTGTPNCDVRSFDGAGAWSRTACPGALTSFSFATPRPTGFWATASRSGANVMIDETFEGPPLPTGLAYDLTTVAGVPAIAQGRVVYFYNAF